MLNKNIFYFAISFVFLTQIQSGADENYHISTSVNPYLPPAYMATLGDSMSSATLSNTTAVETDNLTKPIIGASTVLKDVLFGTGANKDTFSWSSGKDIPSHFMRLKDWMAKNEPGVGLEVDNFSVPGVTSAGLSAQARKVVETVYSGKYKYLKYVTVTIGGNDICISDQSQIPTKVDDFKKNVREMFDILATVKQDHPISIFVSSIPNAPDLGREEFQELDVLGNGWTCRYLRSLHNSCVNLLTFATEEEYLERKQVVVAQNDLLKSLTEEAAVLHPNLKTHFSDSFFKYRVTTDVLGYDCFHPNKKGQEALAEITFQDQPFFK